MSADLLAEFAARTCTRTACQARTDLAGFVSPAELLDASDRARSATFVVSTPNFDRDGDVLEPSGCVPDEWFKNGATWFLNHDTDQFPVGSSIDTARVFHFRIEAKRVIATEFFDESDLGRELFRFVSKGWFPGTSVGFRPLELERIKGKIPGSGQAAGYHVTRWALHEISNVGVGANQEALLIELGKSAAGMVLKSLGAWSQGVTLKGDFHEEDHPRAENGQFGSGGGGAKPAGKPAHDPRRPKPGPEDPVHGYLDAFVDPGEGGTPGTAKEAREANRDLKGEGSKFRVVPDGKGGWTAEHVAYLKDEYGDRWTVGTNPLTGLPDVAEPDYFEEVKPLAGDRNARGYVQAFNDPKAEPATPEDLATANEELARDGSRYRLEFDEGYGLWVARPAGGAKRAKAALTTKASALDVQAVLLPRASFPTEDDAVKWLEAVGFDASAVTEGEDGWEATQFPVAELREGTARTEELTDGVTARCGLRLHSPAAEDVTVKAAKPEHVCTCGHAAKITKGADMADTPLSNESSNPDAGNDMAKKVKAGHAYVKALKAVMDDHGEVQDNPHMEKMHKSMCKTLYTHATKAYPDEDFGLEKPEEDEKPEEADGPAGETEGDDEKPEKSEETPDADSGDDEYEKKLKELNKRLEKVAGCHPGS